MVAAWFTAIASSLLDNVTTVVFLTPMVLAVSRQLRMNATALILPMVMASNIGGTATLIGDPPNIMIGSGAGLSFMDFVVTLAAPCLVMMLWLVFFSRRAFHSAYASADTRLVEAPEPAALTDPVLAAWMGAICALVLVGFLTHHVTNMAPAIPATLGAAAALIVQDRLYLRRHRPTTSERIHGVLAVTERDIEWPTLSFFACLFVIVGAAVQTGLIATLAEWLRAGIEHGSVAMHLSPAWTLLFAALLICWVSGVLSALIDNIPFVAVAIPLVASLTASLPGDTTVLWWALSLGACLGGNGSLIGASANVTAAGLAEREGVHISFAQFTRFGAVVAAGTLLIASAFLTVFVLAGNRAATVASLVTFVVVAAAGRFRRDVTVRAA